MDFGPLYCKIVKCTSSVLQGEKMSKCSSIQRQIPLLIIISPICTLILINQHKSFCFDQAVINVILYLTIDVYCHYYDFWKNQSGNSKIVWWKMSIFFFSKSSKLNSWKCKVLHYIHVKNIWISSIAFSGAACSWH